MQVYLTLQIIDYSYSNSQTWCDSNRFASHVVLQLSYSESEVYYSADRECISLTLTCTLQVLFALNIHHIYLLLSRANVLLPTLKLLGVIPTGTKPCALYKSGVYSLCLLTATCTSIIYAEHLTHTKVAMQHHLCYT